MLGGDGRWYMQASRTPTHCCSTMWSSVPLRRSWNCRYLTHPGPNPCPIAFVDLPIRLLPQFAQPRLYSYDLDEITHLIVGDELDQSVGRIIEQIVKRLAPPVR